MEHANVISDEFYNKLIQKWMSGGNMTDIRVLIYTELGLDHRAHSERVVFFGSPVYTDDFSEQFIGYLVAIAPGIVLLETQEEGPNQSLSGLVVRGTDQGVIFKLRPFWSKPEHLASLTIGLNKTSESNLYYHYAAKISCFYKESKNSFGDEYGIETNRWLFLEELLNKWLPR